MLACAARLRRAGALGAHDLGGVFQGERGSFLAAVLALWLGVLPSCGEAPVLATAVSAACACPAGSTCADGGDPACISAVACDGDGVCAVPPDACLAGPGSCQAGLCRFAPRIPCLGVPCPDGGSCDDGNPCNGVETCRAGVCVAGLPPSCDDGNVCTLDSCDRLRGCVHAPARDGTSCSDGNLCNGLEACRAGICSAGTPLRCEDGNPCTNDTCEPARGCVFTTVVDETPCDDANVCNGTSTCRAGRCIPGAELVCNDGNPCTVDSCEPVLGCMNTPLADGTVCAAGNACLAQSFCRSGICRAGATTSCDDGDPCTVDACDAVRGCSHTPRADGADCSAQNRCEPRRACRAGRCLASSSAVSCDDGNPCTADSCDPARGCVHTPVGDGTACGADAFCSAGKCVVLRVSGSAPWWRSGCTAAGDARAGDARAGDARAGDAGAGDAGAGGWALALLVAAHLARRRDVRRGR